MQIAPRSIRLALLIVLAFLVATPSADLYAKGSSGGQKTVHVKGYTTKKGTYVPPHDRKVPTKHTGTSGAGTTTSSTASSSSRTVKRDANGRIERSETAKHAFMKQTGYLNGRPGNVVDHITPLACGGADAPSNMQWQTNEAAKAKDTIERKGC